MHVRGLRYAIVAGAVMGWASVLALGTAGCGNSPVSIIETQSTGPSSPETGIAGRALVGSLPLIGASVQLYAAGTGGNGSAGTALLASPLTTDANGMFSVPVGYTCPGSNSELYVVARGGKAGAAATSANAAIALMAVVGECSQAASSIVVNEVTTVAAAYALSQFLSAGGNVGATATNTTGIENAFATALALANVATGTSPGPGFAANGSSPAAKIDSFANMLNGCAASSQAGAACSGLFAGVTPAGGNEPANTLDAALELTRNPAANVASLYTLASASTAFSPVLAAAPSDWTLWVVYGRGGMNSPSGLGVDGAGNVWVANYFNVASVFSPLGVPLVANGITGFGLSASYGLAVDANNNAWIPNEPSLTVTGNSVSVLTATGQSVAGSGGYTSGGLDYPTSVAIDTDGSAWVVDYGNSHLTHLSSSGAPLSGSSGYTSPLFAFPVFAAVDGGHNVWVTNQSGSTVTEVAPNGANFTNFSSGDGPSTLAIDQLGNVWVANYYGNSVSEILSSGTVVSGGGYVGGGVDHPQGIAIDGAGNVWVANFRAPGITELAGAGASAPGTALSPANGFVTDAGMIEAYSIAVDASGNLWVSNFGSNTLTQVIGMAPPVKTPLIGLPTTP